MNIEFIPTFLKSTSIRNIGKYLDANIGSTVLMPPTYDVLDMEEIISDYVDNFIDLRFLSFKYLSSKNEMVFKEIIYTLKKGSLCLFYPEYLFRGYPRTRKRLRKFFIYLSKKPVIVFTLSYKLFTFLSKVGYSTIQISELGLEESYNLSVKHLNGNFRLADMAEGNLGALTLLVKYEKDIKMLTDKILEGYSNLESGQRHLLYHLSTRLNIGGFSKEMGTETYVYAKRLMDRGELVKIGKRRGNYLIRNPLIRMIINIIARGKDYIWYSNGFLYLILRLFQGINEDIALETLSGTLYLSRVSKVKRIDRYRARFMDILGNKYSIYLMGEEERLSYNKMFPHEEDIKILVYPYLPSSHIVRNAKKYKVLVIDPSLLGRLKEVLRIDRKL